jgi:hypothetical protein
MMRKQKKTKKKRRRRRRRVGWEWLLPPASEWLDRSVLRWCPRQARQTQRPSRLFLLRGSQQLQTMTMPMMMSL